MFGKLLPPVYSEWLISVLLLNEETGHFRGLWLITAFRRCITLYCGTLAHKGIFQPFWVRSCSGRLVTLAD